MRIRAPLIAVGVVALLAIVLLSQSLYVVSETEWVVVTEFGKPVRVVPEIDKSGRQVGTAGLYTKTPLIQSVNRLEKRIMSWDGDPNRIPTKDKKYIWIDTFARWRIAQPLSFFQSLEGRIEQGHKKLDDIVDAVVRDVVGSYNLIEVVRSSDRALVYESEELAAEQQALAGKSLAGRREHITKEIRRKAAAKLEKDFGIYIVDIRIKRVNYVSTVRQSIYDRMKSERERIASRFRSEAQEQRDIILGDTNRELAVIRGEAVGRSAEIRGEADAVAMRLYGEAIAKTKEFYEFRRTLEAYKKSVDARTTLILSTEGDFLRFLKRFDAARGREGLR